MFICFKLKFSYVILLYVAFLYLAEKNKALPWKLETACVAFPFTSNFILVWSVSEYPFLFISLTNLIHVYECLGDSYWFFSLSSENASLTKTFQSIIVFTPTSHPKEKTSNNVTLWQNRFRSGPSWEYHISIYIAPGS